MLRDKHFFFCIDISGQFQAHSPDYQAKINRLTEELVSMKDIGIAHHSTFDETDAAAATHWLPLNATDRSGTVGPNLLQFHTHLPLLLSIYTLPGQAAAEWLLSQETAITVSQRPGADIIRQVCHCGERVMTPGHTTLH